MENWLGKQIIITGLDHNLRPSIQEMLAKMGLNSDSDLVNKFLYKQTSHSGLQTLNKKILQSSTAEKNSIFSNWGWTKNNQPNKEFYPSFKAEACAFLKHNSSKNIPTFYDARAGALLDFWTSVAPDTKYILFFFPPWEIFTNSDPELRIYNNSGLLDFWCWYNQQLLDFYLKNKGRCILMDVNCLIDNKNAFVKKVIKDFELKNLDKRIPEYGIEEYAIPLIEEEAIKSVIEHHEATHLYGLLTQHSDIASVFAIQPDTIQSLGVLKTQEHLIKKLIGVFENLQRQNANTEIDLDILNKKNDWLSTTIGKLEYRILEIEKSRLWKMKRFYIKVQSVLKHSTRTTGKKSFLQYLKFFFSRHFIRVSRKFFKTIFKYLYLFFEDKPVKIIFKEDFDKFQRQFDSSPYQQWQGRNSPREADISDYINTIELFKYTPKFSIIVPVYNPPEKYFREMLESVLAQVYTNWELCLSDDNSSNPYIREIIEEYAEKDPRVKYVFRKENGHISACSNSALAIASGEFAVLVDHDDLITSDALYQVAALLNKFPEADLIYSDEDKMDEGNILKEPHFKPSWCPDNLLSRNYFGHLVILRLEIINKLGGFREGFEGSQDYDLLLRFTERTKRIYHIPKVLYHWRMHSESTSGNSEAKQYAYKAAQKALEETLERRGESGKVEFLPFFRGYSIRYQIRNTPKISIIIPSKNKSEMLKACLDSIISKTTYTNYEIIVVDNGSTEPAAIEFYKSMRAKHKDIFHQYDFDVPFNFSKIINFGASKASGDFFVLLNNDTEVISEDWIESMLGYAQRDTTGVIGVKLLYPNKTIQHAGVIIGLGGAAGHVFVGQYRDEPGYFNYINTVNNYSAVTGACMMIKKDIFVSINGFDEKYSVEYNDIDFCLRVKEAGYDNVYLPHVELYHHESISRGSIFSTKEKYNQHIKELGLFKKQWQKYITADPCYNIHLSLGAHDFRIK
jgi:glycosyltransferase involved in cell wall biosynthesis